jgi:hypothetical protein
LRVSQCARTKAQWVLAVLAVQAQVQAQVQVQAQRQVQQV